MTRTIPALALLLALPGCAALSALGGGEAARDAYELRGPAAAPVTAAPRPLDLIVEPPVVAGALDTDRILIRPNGLQVQYLPDGAWTDPPTELLRTALVRALEGTGAFRYVAREPLGPGGDYALQTEITDFQPDLADTGAAVARVRVSARLVREADVAIVGARVFDVAVPAASTATPDLVAALDAAMTRVVAEMAAWVPATLP